MPLSDEQALEAARILQDHRRRGAPLASLPDHCHPATSEDGYAIQAALVALRGREDDARPIGWKIGATNAGARELLGVPEPFYGVLLSSMTVTRSDEHTSELQSLMRLSYAVFCL